MGGNSPPPPQENPRSLKTNIGNKARRLNENAESLQNGFIMTAKSIDQNDEVKKSTSKKTHKDLVRKLKELETIIQAHAAHFEREHKTKSNLQAVAAILKSWLPEASNVQVVRFCHVNILLDDLFRSPSLSHVKGTAWSVLGGVCFNFLGDMHAASPDVAPYINNPLPSQPLAREVVANWITTNVYEQRNRFMDLVKFKVDDVYEPNKMISFESPTPNFGAQGLVLKDQNVVHVYHIPERKTYHVAKYREVTLKIPFEEISVDEIKSSKKRFVASFSSSNEANSIFLLNELNSTWSSPAPTKQATLMRQYFADKEVCTLYVAVIDEGDRQELTREKISWEIVRMNNDGTTTFIRMSTMLGSQAHGHFVPYDGLEILPGADPFDALVEKLKSEHVKELGHDLDEIFELDCISRHIDGKMSQEGQETISAMNKEIHQGHRSYELNSCTDLVPAPSHSFISPSNSLVTRQLESPTTIKNPRKRIKLEPLQNSRRDLSMCIQVLKTYIQDDFALAQTVIYVTKHFNHITALATLLKIGATKICVEKWVDELRQEIVMR